MHDWEAPKNRLATRNREGGRGVPQECSHSLTTAPRENGLTLQAAGSCTHPVGRVAGAGAPRCAARLAADSLSTEFDPAVDEPLTEELAELVGRNSMRSGPKRTAAPPHTAWDFGEEPLHDPVDGMFRSRSL